MMEDAPTSRSAGSHDNAVAHLSDSQLQAAWFWCLVDQDPQPRHRQILDELSRRQIMPGPTA